METDIRAGSHELLITNGKRVVSRIRRNNFFFFKNPDNYYRYEFLEVARYENPIRASTTANRDRRHGRVRGAGPLDDVAVGSTARRWPRPVTDAGDESRRTDAERVAGARTVGDAAHPSLLPDAQKVILIGEVPSVWQVIESLQVSPGRVKKLQTTGRRALLERQLYDSHLPHPGLKIARQLKLDYRSALRYVHVNCFSEIKKI